MEGSTTFTPRDNEVDTLKQNIFLKPIIMDTLDPIDGEIKPPPPWGDEVTDGNSPVEETIQESIIRLLKEKVVKMSASDIGAHLKHQNVDEIKEVCEKMYIAGEISRTGNYRYFILTEEKKKPKKTSVPKSEAVDIPEQIKKLSDLKDQGILTEEEFQSKKKDLLDKM